MKSASNHEWNELPGDRGPFTSTFSKCMIGVLMLSTAASVFISDRFWVAILFPAIWGLWGLHAAYEFRRTRWIGGLLLIAGVTLLCCALVATMQTLKQW